MSAVSRRGLWAATATLAVAGGLVAALLHLGSPAERRLRRLDEQRVSRLQRLQSDLETHLEREGKLPAALADLARMPWADEVARDPVTNAPFDYELLAERRYRLCADFARPSEPPPPDRDPGFWTHPQGRHCYVLEIAEAPTDDPEPGR